MYGLYNLVMWRHDNKQCPMCVFLGALLRSPALARLKADADVKVARTFV